MFVYSFVKTVSRKGAKPSRKAAKKVIILRLGSLCAFA